MSFAVGLALCVLLVYIILPLPFIAFIVGFIVGPIIGEGYARVLDKITRAKRGRALQLAVGIGIGFGLAPLCFILLFAGAIIPFLVSVIFGALVIGAVVRRLI
jgi:MFS family permease